MISLTHGFGNTRYLLAHMFATSLASGTEFFPTASNMQFRTFPVGSSSDLQRKYRRVHRSMPHNVHSHVRNSSYQRYNTINKAYSKILKMYTFKNTMEAVKTWALHSVQQVFSLLQVKKAVGGKYSQNKENMLVNF